AGGFEVRRGHQADSENAVRMNPAPWRGAAPHGVRPRNARPLRTKISASTGNDRASMAVSSSCCDAGRSFPEEETMRVPTILASLPLVMLASGPLQGQEVLTGQAAFGTWEPDAPGVRRHITPADLPPPSHADNDPEAPDFQNMAEVVPAPEGAMPQVPEGFQVEIFA